LRNWNKNSNLLYSAPEDLRTRKRPEISLPNERIMGAGMGIAELE